MLSALAYGRRQIACVLVDVADESPARLGEHGAQPGFGPQVVRRDAAAVPGREGGPADRVEECEAAARPYDTGELTQAG